MDVPAPFRRLTALTPAPSLPHQIPKIPFTPHNAPPRLPSLTLSLPKIPPKPSSFHDKVLFLSSLNIDLLSLAAAHPPLAVAPLPSIRATVDLLLSLGLTPPDLRRASGMCPEILASSPSSILPVLTFLLREAGVAGLDLRRAIHRRPRLLISSVPARLRPTLYFLQSLGITSVARHTALLSCSVEDKLLPRLEFLQRAGFSHRDARSMVRKFPQLFCYSLDCNLKPKLEFLVGVMGRELRELREFPQFFSFSLPNRIGPRHQDCEEKGVFLPLPALLRPSDEEFQARLEGDLSKNWLQRNNFRSRPVKSSFLKVNFAPVLVPLVWASASQDTMIFTRLDSALCPIALQTELAKKLSDSICSSAFVCVK